MSLGDVNAQVPQVRPHLQRRDRNIFFMIARRPLLELSPEDVPLYESIDGHRTVAELEKMHPGAADRLLKWREAEILELIPPISSPARPHLVVIEPHMDDAVLSAGGRLLHRRGRCRTTILTVVKWSNFTSYLKLGRDFLNLSEITDLRLKESALALRLLGAEHHCMDWTDAPLRLWPADRWSAATAERFRSALQVFTDLMPDPKDVSLQAEQLLECLTALAPDELWIPMGLGYHIDHRTTRSACLMMLSEARDRFSGIPVSMYEDLPYASAVGHAAQIRTALSGAGARLVRTTEDITDVFEEKVRVTSVYASQFKPSYMESVLRKFADREGGGPGKLAEAYHRLEGKVCLPQETRLSREWAGLARLETGVHALLTDRAERRSLTVMAMPGGSLGKWKIDSESLAAAFPNADFRVYVSDDMAWQTEEGGNAKLKLELVHGGWKGWCRVILREFFHFGTPTVVLWMHAYTTPPKRILKWFANFLIKTTMPFRRVLFAKTLWDFCYVLNEQIREDRVSVGNSEPRDLIAHTGRPSSDLPTEN